MKIRSLLALVGLAISFAVPAFAQQKETVDPQIIEQINNTLLKKYTEAIYNSDAAAIAALFTEDAVFVSVRGPVYGRQAIEKFYVDQFKAWQIKNRTSKRDPNSPRIIGTADNIASNGEWSETRQGKTGEPIQIKGYWSSIVTREGDDWRILMLTSNITPAPVTPAETK
jgi:uncharacterized protein (TIGR02246 family)